MTERLQFVSDPRVVVFIDAKLPNGSLKTVELDAETFLELAAARDKFSFDNYAFEIHGKKIREFPLVAAPALVDAETKSRIAAKLRIQDPNIIAEFMLKFSIKKLGELKFDDAPAAEALVNSYASPAPAVEDLFE